MNGQPCLADNTGESTSKKVTSHPAIVVGTWKGLVEGRDDEPIV